MSKTIAIIGGGPAGLFAAEYLSALGLDVHVFERKPSLARKLLMAGRGGLNLTHSESLDLFIEKYAEAAPHLKPLIENFSPASLMEWCEGLGEKTFIGTSGRVFPESFKASPLLRAWSARLSAQGVTFHINHDWIGLEDSTRLLFRTHDGSAAEIKADATLLALGGASWPKLGSNAAWVDILNLHDINIRPFVPSNCGFKVSWSEIFANKFAGQPLKNVELRFKHKIHRGEMMFTSAGVEGGAIYALSAPLRDEIAVNGVAVLTLDLKPDLTAADIVQRLNDKPRGKMSFTRYLDKALNLEDGAIGLLMEREDRAKLSTYPAEELASIIKAYSLTLTAPFDIDRAISSAGGIAFDELSEDFMLKKLNGIFVAGEMIDWEAPTGGYLLQASFATAHHAAKGIEKFLNIK